MSTMQSFGWATLHDEPMLFPTQGEAMQHCDDDEEPIELVSKDDALAAIKAARVQALEDAAKLYDSEDVLAPVGNSAWGEAYQEGWIAGAQAYREAIRSLIGTPKSAEGEGA